ncbi:LysR family transcriptional regulator [Labrenzia sp. PHM005]|uniref:LysR family transcriptional regulator n=1 Tax=Labrenzia sp. PHM005 TaxID=2590016 RepID=UPI0011408F43|nr:LysR family transcriptional regulator [Labrenzia sp. PHM005]QDG74675.1 LysR family transcriptional regulator [Labrenzia sp. PHM005]
MEHWTEIRTAARVARLGTVTAAADALGVHRATINRHIDTLETALGGKLFQRHAKGFTPTDLGRELLRIADTADDQFEELHRKAKGGSDTLQGDFIVTSIATYASTLMPILKTFGDKHPDLIIRYLVSDSLLRLEYGEAHVAFRAGSKPDNPDNVVREIEHIEMGLFAHASYVSRYGLPAGLEDLKNHRFVGSDSGTHRAPFLVWLHKTIAPENFVCRANTIQAMAEAIQCGIGIGFLPRHSANKQPNLSEVIPPQLEWVSQMWMVTHMDLHRTAKVQAFIKELDQLKRFGDWL